MPKLSVNVDHVATVRQARGGKSPDPVAAALLAELAGADGIIVHLREDRRHIQDRDVEVLRGTVKTKLNLEMANTEEILRIALRVKPDMATFVPERRQELTTEGGLDVKGNAASLAKTLGRLKEAGILSSLFIDAEPLQVEASRQAGADFVEIHTGKYSDAQSEKARGGRVPAHRPGDSTGPPAGPAGEYRPRPGLSECSPFHPRAGNRGVQHRPQHHRPGGPRRAGPRRAGDERSDLEKRIVIAGPDR